MNHYAIAQLAEVRREELIADATLYRQVRKHRTRTSSAHAPSHSRRPRSAFQTWLAAGQL